MGTRSTLVRRLRTVLLTLVALVCLIVGGTLIFQVVTAESAGGAPMPEQTFDFPAGEVADPVTDPVAALAAGQGEAQARAQSLDTTPPDNSMSIPAVGVLGHLIPHGFSDNRSLALPTAVDELTWWTGSAPIDSADGSILVAGHVDDANQGAGALFPVHLVQPGDAVYLTKNGIRTRWKVIRLQSVTKEALPDWVFQGSGGDRELHVVTCGGPVTIDENGRASYRDNVIATAVPF